MSTKYPCKSKGHGVRIFIQNEGVWWKLIKLGNATCNGKVGLHQTPSHSNSSERKSNSQDYETEHQPIGKKIP